MGLFGSKKKQATPIGSVVMPVQVEAVNYETALDYLVGLSDKDYEVINKVAVIYRKANAEAAKAQGIDNEPTTFIKPPSNTELVPAHVNHIAPKSFLDDEDDADIAAILDDQDFIETDQTTSKSKQPKG